MRYSTILMLSLLSLSPVCAFAQTSDTPDTRPVTNNANHTPSTRPKTWTILPRSAANAPNQLDVLTQQAKEGEQHQNDAAAASTAVTAPNDNSNGGIGNVAGLGSVGNAPATAGQ